MNESHIHLGPMEVSIVAYADGVYNVELTNGGETVRLELSEEAAQEVCGLFDEDPPSAEPRPPERWE